MITLNNDLTCLNQLPKTAGVYLFYNDLNELPLYIGKSINIQKRVKNHFQQAKTDTREQRIIKNTCHIGWQSTIGEVGALLLEAKLIRDKFPLHNRKLRKKKYIYSYQLHPENNLKPVLVKQLNNEIVLSNNLYGLFRSQKQAEELLEQLVNSHQLCKKLVGLEKTSRACFGYQVKKCKGACVGIESIKDHDLRLINAFQAYQQRVWPFKNTVGIVESNGELSEIHVIKNWIYLGSYPYTAETTLTSLAHPTEFDIDTYHIICQAIYNKNIRIVKIDS